MKGRDVGVNVEVAMRLCGGRRDRVEVCLFLRGGGWDMSVDEVVSVLDGMQGCRAEGALLSLSRGEDMLLPAMTAVEESRCSTREVVREEASL